MSILICEQSIEQAVKDIFEYVQIPHPLSHTRLKDLMYMRRTGMALIRALRNFGDVQKCYGFDESKLFEDEIQREIERIRRNGV